MMDFGPVYTEVSVGEYCMFYAPHGHKLGSGGSRRLVLFSHGRVGDAHQINPNTSNSDPGNLYRSAAELVRFGYVVASFTYTSTTHWGRDSAIAQVNTNLTWAESNLGVAINKVGWFCYSMGTLLMANWGRQNLAKFAAGVAVAGASNIDYHYPTHTAEIDAAYNTWATNGGGIYNPINNAADLAAKKIYLYAGASDVDVPPGTDSGGVQAYANALGSNCTYEQIAGTHGTLWANVSPETVAAFIHAGDWS